MKFVFMSIIVILSIGISQAKHYRVRPTQEWKREKPSVYKSYSYNKYRNYKPTRKCRSRKLHSKYYIGCSGSCYNRRW